jgi:putative acetyltransferase
MVAVSPAEPVSIVIRKARPGDIARLFEVWETAVAATHDFVSTEDKAEFATLVRDKYLPAADLDVAVGEDDIAIAFMGMTDNEIDSLFVHADARGTGIGRRLVELAVERHGTLKTEVNEQNAQGVEFWKHMGFRVTGRSELDGQGRPYPLLEMTRPANA